MALRFTGAAAVAFAFALASGTAQAEINTSASNAIIYDYDTNDVLYCKNCEEPMPPSSMSKLMTVELIFQRLKDGRLKPSDTFHVSETAWRQGLKDNESRMFLDLNSDVTVENLLKGIIIQSGGDACIVAAEALAGSEANFAEMANKRAAEIGLTKSHFVNSTGMPDPGQNMSARDLAVLAAHIIREYPEYYPDFAIREFTWNKDSRGRPITQANRNRLLFENVAGVDGLKTGHTEAGGYGLTSSALRDGRRMVVVVNGLNSDSERTSESRLLLDTAFRDFKRYPLLAAEANVGEAQVWAGEAPTVPIKVKKALEVTIAVDSRKDMKVTVSYDGPIQAPITADQEIGKLTVSVPGKPDTIVPVYAGAPVERTGFLGKARLGLRALLGIRDNS